MENVTNYSFQPSFYLLFLKKKCREKISIKTEDIIRSYHESFENITVNQLENAFNQFYHRTQMNSPHGRRGVGNSQIGVNNEHWVSMSDEFLQPVAILPSQEQINNAIRVVRYSTINEPLKGI